MTPTMKNPESVYYPASTKENYGGSAIPVPISSVGKPERNLYVKQVLDWVSLQLAFTMMITVYAYANKSSVIEYINKNPGSVWFPIILSFITLIGMHMSKSSTIKKTMFVLFTISMSMMVAVSVLSYAPDIVCKATVTTFVMVFAINRYSKRCAETGKNLDRMAEIGGSMLLVLIVMGIMQIFIKSSLLGFVICFLGVGVFTILLVVDLHLLYSKEDNFQEDPMLAAVGIYLDIINLFLYLLELYKKLDEK